MWKYFYLTWVSKQLKPAEDIAVSRKRAINVLPPAVSLDACKRKTQGREMAFFLLYCSL